MNPDYPRIGFVGDFGAFVQQSEPRFEWDNGDYRSICAEVGGTLPSDCSELVPRGEELPGYGDDYPLEYEGYDSAGNYFEGFEPVDKSDPDGPKVGRFYRQVTGERTFDFNTDGVAHYGLIPDMLADARDNFGADLKPFFNSAEAFLQLWASVYVDVGMEAVDSDGEGIRTSPTAARMTRR